MVRKASLYRLSAQKGGTSSLFAHIIQHPNVVEPRTKEVHYFDYQLERGETWYRSNFPFESTLRRANAITGEASPYYLYHPLAAQNIRELLPSIRLIFVLRDPVERAISQYFHAVKWRQETLDIEEAFAAEDERLRGEEDRLRSEPSYRSFSHQHHSYVSRGLYARQLARFLELFDREQILVVPSEELYGDPHSALRKTFEHIGVDPGFVPDDLEPKNVGVYGRDVPNMLRDAIAARFREENGRLYAQLGVDLDW